MSADSKEGEPLLSKKKEESSYGSATGYNLEDAHGLANIVSQQQSGALDAFDGVKGLASKIGCKDLTAGMSTDESVLKEQRSKYGTNALEPPPKPNLMQLCVEALKDPTMLMLLASSLVSLVLGLGLEQDYETGWIEGTSIMVTVMLVVAVSAGTDYAKATEFRHQQLQLEEGKRIQAVRDGQGVEVHPRDVVVGDILRLAVGDIIPADGVLVQGSKDLKMDESALTGETELMAKSVEKDPFCVSGTNVMQGTGRILVLAVGKHSIQGKILQRIRQEETTEEESPEEEGNACAALCSFGGGEEGATLMDKLDILTMNIGKMGILVAIVVFVVMLVEFIYAEYIQGGICTALQEDEDSCTSMHECTWSSQETCQRQFVTTDVSIILDYFITGITILVVAIPEGLPLAVTLSLAVSMRRMMQDANQVKHMDSCETMGSSTTICSDKTGTLTENKMTCMSAWYIGDSYQHVVGEGSSDNLGQVMLNDFGPAKAKARLLCEAILLNVAPTSQVTLDGDLATYEGNPTDCALIKLTAQFGCNVQSLRNQFKEDESSLDWGVHSIPFSSQRKRMSWIVTTNKTKSDDDDDDCFPPLTYPGKFRMYSKGAPQQMLDACTKLLKAMTPKGDIDATSLTKDDREHFMNLVDEWQAKGLRTLALAYRDFKDEPRGGWNKANDLETEMTLITVVGIEDPLRPSVPDAIAECRKAGIDVRMCTGDALTTAVAIARGCKILRKSDLDKDGWPKNGFAMTGAEFDDRVHRKDPSKDQVVRRVFDPEINDAVDRLADPFLLDDEGHKVLDQAAFDKLWPTLRVLARCQPEDKLALVRGMRKSRVFLDEARCAALYRDHGIQIFPDHQVVAVTGDGTNDAPALKSANVGFAMGVAGTETAKQACDIILLDDNFSSIVKAVMWGRNVFDSISKFIQFQLTVNVVAIALAVIGAFCFSQSPLSAVQMLWVNMIMDSLASLALATELPTKELLDRMPYGRRRPVISNVMAANILGHSFYQIGILCWVLFAPGTLPLDPPIKSEPTQGSLHLSLFFNIFVMLQLFNEFNSRRLPTVKKLRTTWSEWNVFEGVFTNPMFVGVMICTFTLQILIVQFGGVAVNVIPGGLDRNQWILSVALGAGGLLWQLFINTCIVLFAPTAAYEEKLVEKKIASARKATPEELESAIWSECADSNWDMVRLGVRRGYLYSKVFRTNLQTGMKISLLAHGKKSNQKEEESILLLGRQSISRKSG